MSSCNKHQKAIGIGLGGGRPLGLPAGTEDTLAGVPTVIADGSVTLPLRVTGGAHSPGPSLDLLWLQPDGAVNVFPVDGDPTGFFTSFEVWPYKAIPNGLGGVLVAFDVHYYHGFPYDQARLRLVHADGTFGGWTSMGGTDAIDSWGPTSAAPGDLVLGEDRIRTTSYRYTAAGPQVRITDVTLDGHSMTDGSLDGDEPPTYLAAEGGFVEMYPDGSIAGPTPEFATLSLARPDYAGSGVWFDAMPDSAATSGAPAGSLTASLGPDVVSPSVWGGPQGGRQSANSSPIGRRYETPDAAAIAALRAYLPESLKFGQEYGGSVCTTGPKRFYITEPARGSQDRVLPTPCWRAPEISQVGGYHTHAEQPVLDEPSGEDADKYRANQLTGYLGVADTDLRREPHVELIDCSGRGNIYKFELLPYIEPPLGQPEPPLVYRFLQIIACAPLRTNQQ